MSKIRQLCAIWGTPNYYAEKRKQDIITTIESYLIILFIWGGILFFTIYTFIKL
jgi:hypothetical protein